MNNINYTWQDIETAANSIVLQMYKDSWRPDYIVGITRGGLTLATMLSYRLDVPMAALQVSINNGVEDCETNCWLSEWAFGYNYPEETGIAGCRWDLSLRKKILVVDDNNISGEVFNWVKQDWQGSCLSNETDAWNSVWHKSVRFAAITNDAGSSFNTDYCWKEVNNFEQSAKIVYPWQQQ